MDTTCEGIERLIYCIDVKFTISVGYHEKTKFSHRTDDQTDMSRLSVARPKSFKKLNNLTSSFSEHFSHRLLTMDAIKTSMFETAWTAWTAWTTWPTLFDSRGFLIKNAILDDQLESIGCVKVYNFTEFQLFVKQLMSSFYSISIPILRSNSNYVYSSTDCYIMPTTQLIATTNSPVCNRMLIEFPDILMTILHSQRQSHSNGSQSPYVLNTGEVMIMKTMKRLSESGVSSPGPECSIIAVDCDFDDHTESGRIALLTSFCTAFAVAKHEGLTKVHTTDLSFRHSNITSLAIQMIAAAVIGVQLVYNIDTPHFFGANSYLTSLDMDKLTNKTVTELIQEMFSYSPQPCSPSTGSLFVPQAPPPPSTQNCRWSTRFQLFTPKVSILQLQPHCPQPTGQNYAIVSGVDALSLRPIPRLFVGFSPTQVECLALELD